MTVLTEQEADWVDSMAGRLRLIHADAASKPAEERLGYLQEEVARNLKSIPPANQRRFLEALLARFPVRGQVPSLTAAAPIPVPTPAPAPAPPKAETPQETIERFFVIVARLPEDQRAQLSRRIFDAGLARVDLESPVDVPDEWRQKLGLQPNQRPRLRELAELAVLLTDMFSRLDQTALTVMRELSPRSKLLRRPEDFRAATARFVCGGGDPLDPYLRAVSSLLGGMLTAILSAGKDFARQHWDLLSPSNINQTVEEDGDYSKMVVGKSKQHCCWEKYRLLFEENFTTADLIDRRIKDCMKEIVERPTR
jgi:hypothetical protein